MAKRGKSNKGKRERQDVIRDPAARIQATEPAVQAVCPALFAKDGRCQLSHSAGKLTFEWRRP